jgi:hypothetical protein
MPLLASVVHITSLHGPGRKHRFEQKEMALRATVFTEMHVSGLWCACLLI